jgi:hypothetical protein
LSAETPSPAPRGLSGPTRGVFAAALVIYLGVAAWLVWRTAILEPYSDMFDWLERYYRYAADGDLGRYLWAPHNFHHLVATFAVLALDIRAFGASGYLFLATGVGCWAATAAMMAALGGQAAGPGLRLIGAGGAAALALMGCDALDATADINTTYVYALVFAGGAIVVAERASAGLASRLAALALAAAAGFGSAAGLAVWPALLFSALRRGHWRWTVAVAAGGVAAAGVYWLGETRLRLPVTGAGGADAATVASFVANYLALPWARAMPAAADWAASVLIAVATAAALVAAFRSPGRLARVAGALIVFSFATAAMAALARSGVISPQMVPVRYAVFLIPLHVGLWLMALPHLRTLWLKRPKPMERVAIAMAGLMILHQAVMTIYAVRTADEIRAVIDAFHRGERTPAMLTTIYPDLDKAQALSARLRREGRYQRELRP